jgi:hypothetical protein
MHAEAHDVQESRPWRGGSRNKLVEEPFLGLAVARRCFIQCTIASNAIGCGVARILNDSITTSQYYYSVAGHLFQVGVLLRQSAICPYP